MLDEWGIPKSKEVEEETTTTKEKKKNSFEIINSCFNKRFVATAEETNSLQEFLFLQILSNHPATIDIANFVNIHEIPIDQVYNLVNKLIPRGAIKYIPYPKKNKTIDDESIENICKFYKCNIAIGNRYADMLPQVEIDKINDIYRQGGIIKTKRKKNNV